MPNSAMHPVAMPVVITRPLAQAGALAAQVEAMGRSAIVFPLLEIHALADTSALLAALKEMDSYAMVSFVSPNAIDACCALWDRWPAHVALSVMGEGSRQALARYGINCANHTILSPQNPEQTDSQTLLCVLDLPALRGKKVLIIRGESGRELLADDLRAAGVQVTQIAAYSRAAPVLDSERRHQLHQLLTTENDWIVTSSEALRILLQLVQQCDKNEGVAKMQQQKIIVPHARIAETAQKLGFQHILLTGSGDERLLAALQS